MQCLIGVTLVALAVAAAAGTESECKSANDCNTAGTQLQFQGGRVDTAIEFFESQAYNNLALAHLKKGNSRWALAYARLALERQPDNKGARTCCCSCCSQNTRPCIVRPLSSQASACSSMSWSVLTSTYPWRAAYARSSKSSVFSPKTLAARSSR